MLGLASRTIEATPVQTGRLRSNWQVSTAGYIEGELDITSSSAPIIAAASVAASMDIGDTFYFSNNLDYAEEQEQKKGMLEKSLNALLVEIG